MRETAPNRVSMSIGKMGAEGSRSTNPLAHVRMIVRDSDGNETFGCSADRLSVRWLDKRPGREKARKLREMVRLIADAREIYLSSGKETSPPQMLLFPKVQPHKIRGEPLRIPSINGSTVTGKSCARGGGGAKRI